MAKLLVAPLEAVTDPRLTEPERRVLMVLYSFRGKDTNVVFPGLDAIAVRAGYSDTTWVSKQTSGLAKKGWLTKKRRGFTGGNSYTLVVPEEAISHLSKLEQETNLGSETNLDQETNSKLESETNSKLEQDSKYKEQTKEQTIEQDKYIAFEEFWSLYPKHTNKAKAVKVWTKLKVTENLFGLIAENIDARLRVGQWADKQFIPDATTYLNGKRWEDEVIPPRSQPRGQGPPANATRDRPLLDDLTDRSWAGIPDENSN